MNDVTEPVRREMIETGQPRADLAAELRDHAPELAPMWDTAALQRDFEVIGFAAPFVVVRRKSDGVKGSLEFMHHPRVYFGFRADTQGEDQQ